MIDQQFAIDQIERITGLAAYHSVSVNSSLDIHSPNGDFITTLDSEGEVELLLNEYGIDISA